MRPAAYAGLPLGSGAATRGALRRGRFSELLAMPAGEPAERGEPEEQGHFREVAVWILEKAGSELAPNAGDDTRERFAFLREAPVNGAPIDAEMLRDGFDGARSSAEKAHHEPAHLLRQLVGSRRGIGVQHLARQAREPWIGIGIRDVEIPARTDDAVKCVTELDPAPEQPVVFGAIGGRIV